MRNPHNKHIRIIFLFVLLLLFIVNGQAQPIIADHTVVDEYDIIPQEYIDEVKKMWAIAAGESHSFGYRKGLLLLESNDLKFQVSVIESGTPEGPTDQNLRFSRATWGNVSNASGWIYNYGEEDWYTSTLAIDRTKAGLQYANTNGYEINAMGFGWCWDMAWSNTPSGTVDPLYKVRWAGSSAGGLDGNKIWGLDQGDSVLTGNRVSMDTYLQATEDYIDFCETNGYKTMIYFTTGPVDNATYSAGERGFQRYVKTEYIRDYVTSRGGGYLFDYSDILCWSNSGEQNLVTWTDHGSDDQEFEYIHPDNMVDLSGSYVEDGDHIGEVGTVRLAKAMWWMLARMAGWDGLPVTDDAEPPSIPLNLDAAVTSDTSAILNWDACSDNVGVSGYHIYRDGISIGTSVSTSYVDSSLIIGITYSYAVTAYDAVGNESDPSSSVQVKTDDTGSPSIPLNLDATVTSDTSAILSWDASTDNVGVSGYHIYRDGISLGTSVSTSYVDSSLIIGITYSYTVSAYDAAGNESDPSSSFNISTNTESNSNWIFDFAAPLSIYPNPVTDYLTIELPVRDGELRVEIFSALGILVHQLKYNCTEFTISISILNLKAGNYFVKVYDKNHSYLGRFIVIN
ncbi:T9SS type A sorting domain-containing protein [Bacteroidota bacterium]